MLQGRLPVLTSFALLSTSALSSQVMLSFLEGMALPRHHGVPHGTELGVQHAGRMVSRQRQGLSSPGTTGRQEARGAPQSSASGQVRERAVGSLRWAGGGQPDPL